jgi:phosphoesterase RecJ-like protein
MAHDADSEQARIHRAVWNLLTDGAPAVVTSHARLDGDGIGAALALWHGLRHKGVEACHFFQHPIPGMFAFLDGLDECCADPSDLPKGYNLVVIDCGCLERVGELAEHLTGHKAVVNIDHHDSNTGFGDVNYVDGEASSCGEMVYELLLAGGVPMNRQIAECIFTAIVTDTGQFSHQDTTPRSLVIGAECMRAGAEPHKLVRRLFMSPSPAQVKLRHLALGTLRFHDGGRAATMLLTREMFEQTGLGPEETEGFAEIPISIQGVQASALLKEMPGCDYIKVSMRSRDAVDVCAMARAFGGGGHKHAAGCEMRDTIENVRRTVADELAARVRAAAGR